MNLDAANESDRYQTVRRIGSGHSGPVYLARGVSGEVAIRQFQSASESGSEAWRADRESFLAAARLQTTLADPSIVPTVEVLEGSEDASVVMGYVDASTLQATMQNRRFSPEETNTLLRRLALALDFAHSRGVVHGDLKPSNIFLLASQEIVLGDFAISPRARIGSQRVLPPGLTHGYLSPEHFNVPVVLEARSDQYSLAVIAYELYTGHMPFGIAPDYRTAALSDEMAPSRVNPKLPPGVDAPLMRALSRNPAHRFSSCMEFISDLSARTTQAPVIAEKRGGPAMLPVVATGLAAVLALLVGFLVFSPGKKPAPVAVAPAVEKPAPAPNVPASMSRERPAPRKQPKEASRAATAAAVQAPKQPVSGGRTSVPVHPAEPQKEDRRPRPASAAVPVAPVSGIRTQLLSRSRPIPKDFTFSMSDPAYGELAHGDLKAIVHTDAPVSRSRLTIEWTVSGTVTDRQKPVLANELMEYNNEPIPGSYKVTVRLDGRPVEEFRFRITP